jgi:hypothetical protein
MKREGDIHYLTMSMLMMIWERSGTHKIRRIFDHLFFYIEIGHPDGERFWEGFDS